MEPRQHLARVFVGGLVVAIVLVAAGCGPAPADPAFESTTVIQVFPQPRCRPDRICVEVRAPVVGSRVGEGACRIYGPGDPEPREPLERSGTLEMRPGETTVWATDVVSVFGVDELNPVCEPMVEG